MPTALNVFLAKDDECWMNWNVKLQYSSVQMSGLAQLRLPAIANKNGFVTRGASVLILGEFKELTATTQELN